jgi:hypothetical protein
MNTCPVHLCGPGPSRTVINNHKQPFNSLGVRLPMLLLSQIECPELLKSMCLLYPDPQPTDPHLRT